jgi:hypothetical protein
VFGLDGSALLAGCCKHRNETSGSIKATFFWPVCSDQIIEKDTVTSVSLFSHWRFPNCVRDVRILNCKGHLREFLVICLEGLTEALGGLSLGWESDMTGNHYTTTCDACYLGTYALTQPFRDPFC